MKRNQFISTLLGLVLIATISLEVIDNFVDCCYDKDSIELTESSDDTDEEDLLEEWVFMNHDSSTLHLIPEDKKVFLTRNANQFEIYVKIPIPPPEFAS